MIPTRAEDNALVPTTPKCTKEKNLPWYLFLVCVWIIEVLLTIMKGIAIPCIKIKNVPTSKDFAQYKKLIVIPSRKRPTIQIRPFFNFF